jgi:hypothetical protein
MKLSDRFRNAALALVGIPALQPDQLPYHVELDDQLVERIRASMGGALQPVPQTRTRWLLADLENAQRLADQGDLRMLGQLWRSTRRDGVISGLTKTRTSGLVALPKIFRGREEAIKVLKDTNRSRSIFDEMFPSPELARLAADGIGCGVGVAELVPVKGREHPMMVTLSPEFLQYRWSEGRWYYTSVAGQLPITPGDGRWILHVPGARMCPWQSGCVEAVGRAFILKEHALLHRANFSGKLANPARVAYAPQGGTEAQRAGFLSRLISWGLNSVFELPPGWDAKLLESNGRGWEVFAEEIETADHEAMIQLAGQVVTTTGGTGFANADIHETIRADLIQETADGLALTMNTQGLPAWMFANFGADSLEECVRVAWDISRPSDRKAEGEALGALATALAPLQEQLARAGLVLDVAELANRFGAPMVEGATPDPALLEAKDGEEKDDENGAGKE